MTTLRDAHAIKRASDQAITGPGSIASAGKSHAWRMATLFIVMTTLFPLVSAAADQPPTTETQTTFASAEQAVKTLVSAAKTKDMEALGKLFGPKGRDLLSSGNEAEDKNNLELFTSASLQLTRIVKDRAETSATLYIGKHGWPFPIPLMKADGRWYFDTELGREEVLNRRVGRNEISATRVCRALVKAQQEYHAKDRDGDNILEYAQKLMSDAGQKDGLYWDASGDGEESPLGPIAAQAQAMGYDPSKKAQGASESSQPFHGYLFRILTKQGSKAPGGGKDYLSQRNMVGGFAIVAYPAEWGNSGVMTFIVNQEGIVYEKNLGEDTTANVSKMKAYNPDATWKSVE
ncbi:MAG: DUF2950 domain-containing protein [bacterium]